MTHVSIPMVVDDDVCSILSEAGFEIVGGGSYYNDYQCPGAMTEEEVAALQDKLVNALFGTNGSLQITNIDEDEE